MFAKRKTPKEISESGNQFEKHDWLASASADEIFGYFAYLSMESHQWKCASFALKIRLSKDAEVQSKRMVWFTVGIFFLTAALVALTIVLVFKA
jgi:hypothetical protein